MSPVADTRFFSQNYFFYFGEDNFDFKSLQMDELWLNKAYKREDFCPPTF